MERLTLLLSPEIGEVDIVTVVQRLGRLTLLLLSRDGEVDIVTVVQRWRG